MMRRKAASVLAWLSAKLHRFSHWLEDRAFAINAAEMMRPYSEADTFIPELWAKPEYTKNFQQFMADWKARQHEGDTIHIPRRSMREEPKP